MGLNAAAVMKEMLAAPLFTPLAYNHNSSLTLFKAQGNTVWWAPSLEDLQSELSFRGNVGWKLYELNVQLWLKDKSYRLLIEEKIDEDLLWE